MVPLGIILLILNGCLAASIDETVAIEKRLFALQNCYGPLGCLSTGGPFYDLLHRPIQLLPQPRERINTTFILHTRSNQLNEQLLTADYPESIKNSFFDATKDTKFIVHGFTEDGRKPWVRNMSMELLKRDDWNVISVDWGKGAIFPYTQATANTRVVGAEIAYLIDTMTKELGAKPEKFHIIGHSLGAHTAGYAGERLKYLGRITGMDPADPYFSGTDKAVRLDPSDALFVDVIHTDTGHILNIFLGNGGLGIKEPIGHVDIYPNGGEQQPNCDPSLITTIQTDGIYEGAKQYVACNHMRVLYLYTESINNKRCAFKAVPCDNYETFKLGKCTQCGSRGCALMGQDADTSKPPMGQTNVKYYLETNGNPSYCSTNYGIKIHLAYNSGASSHKGKIWVKLEGTNGITEELLLTTGNQDFQHDTNFGFVTSTEFNPGELKNIYFKWDNDWSLLKPWQWPIFKDKNLYLSKIEVIDNQDMKTYGFCGNGNGILPKDVKILPATTSCSSK